jgi:hypothetical protein
VPRQVAALAQLRERVQLRQRVPHRVPVRGRLAVRGRHRAPHPARADGVRRVDAHGQMSLHTRHRTNGGHVCHLRIGDELIHRRGHVLRVGRRRTVARECCSGGHQHRRGIRRVARRLLDDGPETLHRR